MDKMIVTCQKEQVYKANYMAAEKKLTKPAGSTPARDRTPLESALFQITECAVTTSSIEEYAAALHQIIRHLMYAENFFIALYEEDQSLVNFIYIADEHEVDMQASVTDKLSAEDLRRTLTGYMLKSGQMQHLCHDESNKLIEQNIIDSVGEDSYDWLGVPLKYQEQTLGGIVIQSYDENISYGEEEEKILQFVARQVALVIISKQSELALKGANTELEKRVRKRTEELNHINLSLAREVNERRKSENIQSALYQIADLVSTASSLHEFYSNVHLIVTHLMPAENIYIAILSDDEYISFPYFVDQRDPPPKKRKLDYQKNSIGHTERVLKAGRAILFNSDVSTSAIPVKGSRSVSFLAVPLKDKGKTFGVLAVQSYEQDVIYNAKNKEVLMTIGQQVATTIMRKKDADSLLKAHENLERRVKQRTFELEKTIAKRKLVEEKLEHESLHDSLTGLPNRLHLSKALSNLLDPDELQPEKKLALLFLDLDRFKIINDSLGHCIGDLFLVEVGKSLKHCLRSDDLVARLGGDEFCILMPDIPNESVALKLCTRVLRELRLPVDIDNHSLMTSASIGIRLASSHEDSVQTIMSDADAAMYQAKNQGKNRFCFFDSEIKIMVSKRMQMEKDMRNAIENQEFFLEYQPIYNLKQRKITGFEALVRWYHPKDGIIRPDEFIPIAEETGMIVDIGEEVIKMATETLSNFKKSEELADLYINVNVSSVQILSRTLDDFIRLSLRQHRIEAEKLNIEITESILIEDYEAAFSFVQELKVMGVKVFLDDFGTGYSSLSYLHKFPFDAIKLDRSFITALEKFKNNEAIVESIGFLAHKLDIQIVAEGIETKEQLGVIKKMDYDSAQGYYFSKPMAKEKMLPYIIKTNKLAIN